MNDQTDWNFVSPFAMWSGIAAIGFVAFLRQANPDHWVRILDDANLVFHEAGHPIFGLLGSTLGLYGGTLGQLVFPAVTSWSFWQKRDPVPFVLCTAWFFENFLNIARYMADARAQVLPLVGGGEHDWTNIFTRWGVLRFDTTIAGFIAFMGWLGMASCMVWLGQRALVRRVSIGS